jgi:hypothetical protein
MTDCHLLLPRATLAKVRSMATLVTFREEGGTEWKLQSRSWKVPEVGDKARIGSTLADLEQQVLVDKDEEEFYLTSRF